MKFLHEIDSAAMLLEDANNRLVSDTEKSKWNSAETNAKNYATNLDSARIADTRSVVPVPSDYAVNRTKQEFKYGSAVGLSGMSGTYVHVFTERAWSDPSGGYVHQLAFDGLSNRVWTRYGDQSTDVWGVWEQFGPAITVSKTQPASGWWFEEI